MNDNNENNLQESLDKFVAVHGAQLETMGLPQNLWGELFIKLTQQVLDAGSVFIYAESSSNRTPYSLYSAVDLQKEQDVFLIDHVWTTTSEIYFTQLVQNANLRDMCYALMNISPIASKVTYCETCDSEPTDTKSEIGVEETFPSGYFLQVADSNLLSLESILSDDVIQNTVAVNARNNAIQSLDELVNALGPELCSRVKALYLQNNPVVATVTVEEVLNKFENLEIYNSKLTTRYTEWALLFLHDLRSPESAKNLDLSDRNITIWKPEVFNLFSRCNTIDISNTNFTDYSNLISSIEKLPRLAEILIDYSAQIELLNHGKQQLASSNLKINGWFARASLPSIEEINTTQIQKKIWEYLETYQFAGMYTPNWYMMDQCGTSISHSDTPNVKIAPFFYADADQAFTLLWPVEDIPASTEISRDFLFGMQLEERRELLKTIWSGIPDLSPVPATEEPLTVSLISFDDEVRDKEQQKEITVYTDSKLVIGSLGLQTEDASPKFVLTEDRDTADVIFVVHEHFRDFDKIKNKKQFINQIEKEDKYTMKGQLARLVKPLNLPFFPEMFDMLDSTQIREFLVTYTERKEKNEDNLWIAKPWNLSRSMGMVISDDYRAILKSIETGPKVAAKYISKPSLLTGRKYDFRFMVMVKPISESEITAYVHNGGYIRISNEQYSLDTFHRFQKHFTAMNYYEDPLTGQKQEVVRYSQQEFIELFEKELGSWPDTRQRIYDALAQFFAILKPVILQDDRSCYQRAVYGVDVMLGEDLNPFILEVNYSPDATRLCKFEHPQFYIDVFTTLFTDTTTPNVTKLL